MKNLASYKVMIIALMITFTIPVLAQKTDNNIPSNVTASFATKYPKAEVKKWDVADDGYTAKAKEGSHKYFATFDKYGNWVKTVTKHNWSWDIDPVVKKAFRKSKYGYWHVYAVAVIDSPTGQICQVMVNDTNHPVDALHQDILSKEHLLVFKMNGELVEEKDITPSLQVKG